MASPLEYLKDRYNIQTQQALAWSGLLLKIVDVGAKWAAIATLLAVFTGITITQGILITGVITAVYCTVGGLWADALTELGQFIIQLIAGVAMLVATMGKLGGFSAIWTVWDKLPSGHTDPTAGPYTVTFLLAYLFIKTFEYNGGMWNQAQRYMATDSARSATRSATLSSLLWLVWPVVLFFPMWCAPLLVHAQKPDASDSYALMTESLLPHGLLGLVVVGFFSHTMAMCSSDANAISAVFTRDIAPAVSRAAREWSSRTGLLAARVSTLGFLALSMALATQINSPTFKDIISVVIKWVAGLMGPIAIPFMLGLLRSFRKSGPTAALVSLGGRAARVLLHQLPPGRLGQHRCRAGVAGLAAAGDLAGALRPHRLREAGGHPGTRRDHREGERGRRRSGRGRGGCAGAGRGAGRGPGQEGDGARRR